MPLSCHAIDEHPKDKNYTKRKGTECSSQNDQFDARIFSDKTFLTPESITSVKPQDFLLKSGTLW